MCLLGTGVRGFLLGTGAEWRGLRKGGQRAGDGGGRGGRGGRKSCTRVGTTAGSWRLCSSQLLVERWSEEGDQSKLSRAPYPLLPTAGAGASNAGFYCFSY